MMKLKKIFSVILLSGLLLLSSGMSNMSGTSLVGAADDDAATEEGKIIDGSFTISGGGLDDLSENQIEQFNPLTLGNSSEFPQGRTTVGGFVSQALTVVYPLVGVLLFALLIWGGIEIMMSGVSGNQNLAGQGKKRIMAAIIGIIIVLAAMVIIKVIEAILGIDLGI